MCKNLTAISFIVLELRVNKVEKLDVCNWRVFANPVTIMVGSHATSHVLKTQLTRLLEGKKRFYITILL